MSEYKLIKKLPFENSPEIGYISKPVQNKLHYWKGNWYNPKDYPEFWEKVVEKDYEILSFININDGNIFNDIRYCKFLNQKQFYSKTTGTWVSEIAYAYSYAIYSVKRLSDEEIFTVGDRIENTNNPHINDKIYGISLEKDEIHVYYQGYDYLQDISHCKQVLFTTKDGVDIFKGGSYYNVYDFKICNKLTAMNPLSKHEKLVFSTKEAAEKYILMNKPCLSINDVVDLEQYNPVETKTSFINKLKNIAKKKII